MKQKHINNAVVYLARSIFFMTLLGFYLMFTFAVKPAVYLYWLITPFVFMVVMASIGWSIIMFVVEVEKAVKK